VIAGVERNDGVVAKPLAELDHRGGDVEILGAGRRRDGVEIIGAGGIAPGAPAVRVEPADIDEAGHEIVGGRLHGDIRREHLAEFVGVGVNMNQLRPCPRRRQNAVALGGHLAEAGTDYQQQVGFLETLHQRGWP
jgi:hypothetical protein